MIDRLKSVFCGLLLIVGGFLFWLHLLGNPIHELSLIRRGVAARGVIKDGGASYEFRLPNGQMVKGKTGEITYYMPESGIAVEYLPDNPAISRIKGDGSQTIGDWLLYGALAGGVLLAMFVSPGVFLICREFYPKPVDKNRK